jgi:hypothetical protein
MTMHAILREGLAMWFAKHGYYAPMSEMDLRTRPATKKVTEDA